MKQLTQQQKEILVSNLKEAFNEQIKHVKKYIEIAEELDITNEQFFIDYLDELNKLSVSH